jgi:hypothetical protein
LVAAVSHLEAHRTWVDEYNAVTSEQEESEQGTYHTRPGGNIAHLVQLPTPREPGGTCTYTTRPTDVPSPGRGEGDAFGTGKFDSFAQFQDNTYRWVASLDHRLESICEHDFRRLVNWGFIQALLQWAPHNQTALFAPWSLLVPVDPLRQEENLSNRHNPLGPGYRPTFPAHFRSENLIWNPVYELPYPDETHSQSWIREFRDAYL